VRGSQKIKLAASASFCYAMWLHGLARINLALLARLDDKCVT